MRKLIIVSSDLYIRDFLSAGAFDEIDDESTYWAAGPEVSGTALSDRPNYAGAIEMPQARRSAYGDIRRMLLTSFRFRSRTARVKLGQTPLPARWLQKLEALPGIRQLRIRRRLRATGPNPSLDRILDRVRPDLVIVPSSGVDAVVVDAVRSAKPRGIPTLALMYNWDNLSSKAAFAVEPDYVGVAGHQAVDHAERIHRLPRERVAVLGSPYIDPYFRHVPGAADSPFPFPYALFAGCYQPFDELTALREIEATIEREGLDLKVVYLPHPRRLARKVDDFVDDDAFRHVLVEPRVRDAYRAQHGQAKGRSYPLPLDYYPSLLGNAEFVVCPLSTLMLEAAIFGRRVLVIAYHDGLHGTSPGVAIDYLHFDGVEAVDTFEVCRRGDALGETFLRLARDGAAPRRPPKEQLDQWVYHDDRGFAERLAELVAEIETRRRPSPASRQPAAPAVAPPAHRTR
jgi:hypothetical protein